MYPTKGAGAVLVLTQFGIDGIEEVAAHHRYLVDDEEVEGADEVLLVLAHLVVRLSLGRLHARDDGSEGELEEGMDGLALCVDGCHACRGEDDHSLRGEFVEFAEEGGLACACLACEEDADVCAGDVLPGEVHLVVVDLVGDGGFFEKVGGVDVGGLVHGGIVF